MSWQVSLTDEARDDLERLFTFLAEVDLAAAENARDVIAKALVLVAEFPWSCRKVGDDPLLREVVIPFGRAGYVGLFKIVNAERVVLLAFRHQREEDYLR